MPGPEEIFPAPPTTTHGAESSPLGRTVSDPGRYAPELLFPIKRSIKRRELGIDRTKMAALPFVGEDLWNAYELSWLNPRGKPVVALGRLRVPADSPCLIESKSLKLYFNSFNFEHFSGLEEVARLIERDLSAAAGAAVRVDLETLPCLGRRQFAPPPGRCIDDQDLDIDTFSPDPTLLQLLPGERREDETLYSHLLRSNCLVTGQPDWGTLALRYTGPAIDAAGLLRYLVSFRNHPEFHEQCVERIYIDVLRSCQPSALMVWARYTRRGGLDINPLRSSGHFPFPPEREDPRQ